MQIADGKLKPLLEKSNKVSDSKLTELEDAAKKHRNSLQEEVIDEEILGSRELDKLYAESVGFKFIDLKNEKLEPKLLEKIPERTSRKYQAVLFGETEDKYRLAMADPGDLQGISFLGKLLDKKLDIYMAAEDDVARALDSYKGSLDTEITKVIPETETETGGSETEVSAEDVAEDSPVAKTVNLLIEYAIKASASDIHIEPRENVVQIRYRIDGVLREANTLPRNILPALVSRIKIMSNLKIDEHRKPQDGRIKIDSAGRTIAIRISTLPVMEGEKVVMRLLDESARALTLEELGFNRNALGRMHTAMKEPNGLILVTGPTGAGKSTTLYSILSKLNQPGVNISTVEDPVEYRIEGVNQTQVNPQAGMTFANGLRALLRQDPDIIMVGEIRDSETAELAIQAALTGHLVLSTLHTNDAVTSLPRLLDMGAEPFLISSTVKVVAAQRLVRKLCAECRQEYEPDGRELEELKNEFDIAEAIDLLYGPSKAQGEPEEAPENKPKKKLEPISDLSKSSILDKIAKDPEMVNRSAGDNSAEEEALAQKAAKIETAEQGKRIDTDHFKLWKPGKGCDECGPDGYRGRVGIYEVLEVNEEIGKLIVGNATSDELQIIAEKEGMITMEQDGFLKALQGITSVEEILRVIHE
ncbi:MAG: GspE/PulE family protein [Candidatus Saccharimonadales bacterium]